MSEVNEKKGSTFLSWLNTIPGIITSIATLITAIGSLLLILDQHGFFKKNEQGSERVTTIPDPDSSSGKTSITGVDIPQPFEPYSIASVTGAGDNLFYFFSLGEDNLIYYANGEIGGKKSDWKPVDGKVSAASAPFAGAVNSQLFVAVRGTDNHIYLNQATAGNSFNNSWQDMGFQTDVAPAVVGVQNFIYIFSKNLEGRIYFNRALLGHSFEGWKEVEGNGIASENSSPSVGVIGNYMYILIKDKDNKVLLNQGATDGTFQSQWQYMNFTTYASPAAVGVGKYIYFFVIGIDGQVSYDYAELGGGGHGWKMFTENNPYAETVTAGAVGNNYLFITIKGKDEKLYLNQGDVLSNFNIWNPLD